LSADKLRTGRAIASKFSEYLRAPWELLQAQKLGKGGVGRGQKIYTFVGWVEGVLGVSGRVY